MFFSGLACSLATFSGFVVVSLRLSGLRDDIQVQDIGDDVRAVGGDKDGW